MIANLLIALLFLLPLPQSVEHRITTYSTGHRTADGSVIDYDKVASGEIRWCAVSRQHRAMYPYGTLIYVDGHGLYVVRDTMSVWVSEKWPEGTIDILCHPSWNNQWRDWRRVWVIFKQEKNDGGTQT